MSTLYIYILGATAENDPRAVAILYEGQYCCRGGWKLVISDARDHAKVAISAT